MVKNKTGGNKAKKQGRKHASVPQNRNTRFAKEDGEMYAVITKIFGGPNCEAICNDGKTRMCVIRNKFRGRDKKDNTISNNTWVLVGLRDWEVVANGKLEKCDLLEVYNPSEMDRLKDTVSFDWSKFKHIGSFSNDNISNTGDDAIAFEFTDNDNSDLMNNIEKDTQHILKTEDLIDNSDEINIDDI